LSQINKNLIGAGKTTFVNYLLKKQNNVRIAVIENEFGAVSIDDDLVSESLVSQEDVITLGLNFYKLYW